MPSPPCPAPAAAKACFSSHKRCTIERLSLSLFRSPSFFYFSSVLVLPVGKAGCQPLPKAGQSALTLYANASPQAQLTHSFCAPHHHLLLRSFIYFFHLLLHSPSLTLFSLSCPPHCCYTSTIPPLFFFFFCCFTPSRPPNCMCTFYLNCYPSSSISPLRSHSLLSLWSSLSPPFPAASLTHCLTHPVSNLYTHSSASARQASAETPFPLSPSFSVSFTLSCSLVHTVTHARVYFP